MKRKVWLSLLLAMSYAFILPACAGPLKYSAASIEAWVVDKETGQPLEGVIVVAHWQLEHVSRIVPHQTNTVGELMVLEAVTDKNGRFYFPAWGPKWHLGAGNLTDSDPELILFKSGYKYLRVSNSRYLRPAKYSDVGKPSGTESKPTGSKRISFWSGERITLKPFKGTAEEYASHLSFLMTSLRFIEDDCHWKTTPQMVLALQKQSEIFKASGITRTIYSVDYLPTNKAKCGSPEEFFRSFKP